ncbi:MAG: YceI family protein [Bacteroidota bacterium]|nr:YceI family protein [Bacteroidota bacterium]
MRLKQILTISTIVAGISLSGNWYVDTPNAKLNFTVEGPFGTVHGSFTGLEATIKFDEKDLSGSSMSASIDAKTVSTGIGLRNRDLRNEEKWLNTDKYPRINFRSRKIEKTTNGYKVIGDLTIKGIVKSAEIPFTFSSKGTTGLFAGHFTINRTDYNLGNAGGSVGSIITIILTVPVKN